MCVLKHHQSFHLAHHDECGLLMVDNDLTIYVEEVYDGWVAQHAIDHHGEVLQSIDEDYGRKPLSTFLHLPAHGVKSAPPTVSRALNFQGPRQRGVRGEDRIDEIVRPLSVESKMWLANKLQLPFRAFLLLGVAESHVIAQAPMPYMDEFVVCRRLRLAYALQQPQMDSDHQIYDYDTLVLHVAHLYNGAAGDTELPVEGVFMEWPGVNLERPMDCLVHQNHLFIAEGGTHHTPSRVHVWQIQMSRESA